MFPNIPTKVIKDFYDAYKMSLKSIWNSEMLQKVLLFAKFEVNWKQTSLQKISQLSRKLKTSLCFWMHHKLNCVNSRVTRKKYTGSY